MIMITVNWFSFILGFVSCIIVSVLLGVIGYFKDITQKNKILEKMIEFDIKEK